MRGILFRVFNKWNWIPEKIKKLSGPNQAQVAMEYLLITAFAFIILAVIIVVAYSHTSSFSSDVTSAQLQKVANQIVDAANAVYYMGPPAKQTIRVFFPDGIKNVSISNQSVIFAAYSPGGTYEYALTSASSLSGNIEAFAGIHNLVIQAEATYVNITEG